MTLKVAVMQPYFFPYDGYIDLIKTVDLFIIFDDVNYKKKGWINRNRVLHQGQEQFINLPINAVSQNKKINELTVGWNSKSLDKTIKHLNASYAKSVNFYWAMPIIECWLKQRTTNLAIYLGNILIDLSKLLNTQTEFVYSSQLSKHEDYAHTHQRIIDLTVKNGGNEYVNLPGGRDLYDETAFREQGLKLSFIESNFIPYQQPYSEQFKAGLSIIDRLMNDETLQPKLKSFHPFATK